MEFVCFYTEFEQSGHVYSHATHLALAQLASLKYWPCYYDTVGGVNTAKLDSIFISLALVCRLDVAVHQHQQVNICIANTELAVA